MSERDHNPPLVIEAQPPARKGSEGIDDVRISSPIAADRWQNRWSAWKRDKQRGFGRGYYYDTIHRAIRLEYDPIACVLTARINIPKWVGQQAYNWPFALVESVEDLRLTDLQKRIESAVGLNLTAIPRWAVRAVSLGADTSVLDEASAVEGIAELRRAWDRRGPRRVGNERLVHDPYSVYWSGNRGRWYGKGHELDQRGYHGVAGVLRFEATFGTTEELYALFAGAIKGLPTLACFCRPEVRAWALGREARRYRFVESSQGPRPNGSIDLHTPDGVREVRHVRAVVNAYAAGMEAGRKVLGSRKTLTETYVRRLVEAWTLASSLSRDELAHHLGVSKNVVRLLIRDLTEMGVPPATRSATSVSEQVLPQLRRFLDAAATMPEFGPDDAVASPWSELAIPPRPLARELNSR